MSRGGANNAPGTTVEEHALWALVGSSGLHAPGSCCARSAPPTVAATTPIKPSVRRHFRTAVPRRRHRQQAATFRVVLHQQRQPGRERGRRQRLHRRRERRGNCYVVHGPRDVRLPRVAGLTRPGTIPNLKILTRDNSASAPGRRERADQLLPRLHHQPEQAGRDGQRHRRPGLRQLPDLAGGPGAAEELPRQHRRSGRRPVRRRRVAEDDRDRLPEGDTAAGRSTVTGQVTNAQPGFPAPSGATVTRR